MQRLPISVKIVLLLRLRLRRNSQRNSPHHAVVVPPASEPGHARRAANVLAALTRARLVSATLAPSGNAIVHAVRGSWATCPDRLWQPADFLLGPTFVLLLCIQFLQEKMGNPISGVVSGYESSFMKKAIYRRRLG